MLDNPALHYQTQDVKTTPKPAETSKLPRDYRQLHRRLLRKSIAQNSSGGRPKKNPFDRLERALTHLTDPKLYSPHDSIEQPWKSQIEKSVGI